MSTVAWIRRELTEIGLVTAYFLACFLFFLTLKKLLLSEYEIKTMVFHTAIISALIVAKVVVLLDNSAFGERFRSGRLATHVFWRSISYTLVVFVVTLAEQLFELSREDAPFSASVSQFFTSKSLHHFLAMNLCVGLSFLAYNGFSEIDRLLGEGGLRKTFFSRPSA